MIIKTAKFIKSSTKNSQLPPATIPEIAFIGRSNVGKSSLINMLTNYSKLAKVSGTPGKTQHINHFIINDSWFLVDLPGYGYAKVSKKMREEFEDFIRKYIQQRTNLYCLFVLVDSRHEPHAIDLEFMQWLGECGIPFAVIMTKTDKLKPEALKRNIEQYHNRMFLEWEELPNFFYSSSTNKDGKDDILEFIESIVVE